jgi:pimeloyl-ACP methyl ester carboxylesterase
MYTDEWLEINGIRLHYQDWQNSGQSDAPPILLLHGLTQHSHTYDGVAERLVSRYRCLALDVRGRGESDWASPETYVVARYVDDVLKLLAVLGLPAVHVLGTSMGGLIALSLAATAPEVLLSLGLNDVGPTIDPRGVARIARYAAEIPDGFPTFAVALAWALQQYPWLTRMTPEEAARAFTWSVRQGSEGTWRLKFDPAIGRAPQAPPQALERASRLWWDALGALRCPILLVRGAESDILSAETADEMSRLQPGMRRVDLAGVDHAPTLSEPEAVAALDRFYLARR